MGRKKDVIDPNRPFYVCVVKHTPPRKVPNKGCKGSYSLESGRTAYYVMTDGRPKTPTVSAWLTESDAIRAMSEQYVRAEGRGYVGAMSACVHLIMFSPLIVRFENVEALAACVDLTGHYELRNTAGCISGFRLKNGSRVARRGVGVGKGWAEARGMVGGL